MSLLRGVLLPLGAMLVPKTCLAAENLAMEETMHVGDANQRKQKRGLVAISEATSIKSAYCRRTKARIVASQYLAPELSVARKVHVCPLAVTGRAQAMHVSSFQREDAHLWSRTIRRIAAGHQRVCDAGSGVGPTDAFRNTVLFRRGSAIR